MLVSGELLFSLLAYNRVADQVIHSDINLPIQKKNLRAFLSVNLLKKQEKQGK
jgi:hypothetical protein